MSIDFSNEQEQTFDFDFLKVAEDVMETVLDQEGCPYESQVCLVLTDNETIHKTNLEYRQIDRATDVLTIFQIGLMNRFVIVRSTGQRMCCLSLWLIFRHLQIILCWKTMTAALIRKVESFFWETS